MTTRVTTTMKLRYRSVFLSDIHLGSNGCKAEQLSKLLKRIQCEQLYLVGDIIDLWRLRKRWYWPIEHNDVLRRILKIASKRKTEVIFTPGNHDEAARQFHHLEFGGVKVEPYAIHTTADGRQLLVIHGDQFDLVIKHSPLLSHLGGLAYEWLLRINTVYNKLRVASGLRYWSLSNFLKMKVKKACKFISRFEETLSQEARRRELDGVVCGHIHKAEISDLDGTEYFNCGDWVESCTILVEHFDGRMEILDGLALLDQLKQAKEKKESRKSRKLDRTLFTPLVHDEELHDDDLHDDDLAHDYEDDQELTEQPESKPAMPSVVINNNGHSNGVLTHQDSR